MNEQHEAGDTGVVVADAMDGQMCETPLGSVGAKFSSSMVSTKFQIPAAAGGNGDV